MTEDDYVDLFCREMKEKIKVRHNRYTALGWKTLNQKRLMKLLEDEMEELKESGNVNEAVDVANYALFIWALKK